jgi:hypothetical protein
MREKIEPEEREGLDAGIYRGRGRSFKRVSTRGSQSQPIRGTAEPLGARVAFERTGDEKGVRVCVRVGEKIRGK